MQHNETDNIMGTIISFFDSVVDQVAAAAVQRQRVVAAAEADRRRLVAANTAAAVQRQQVAAGAAAQLATEEREREHLHLCNLTDCSLSFEVEIFMRTHSTSFHSDSDHGSTPCCRFIHRVSDRAAESALRTWIADRPTRGLLTCHLYPTDRHTASLMNVTISQ